MLTNSTNKKSRKSIPHKAISIMDNQAGYVLKLDFGLDKAIVKSVNIDALQPGRALEKIEMKRELRKKRSVDYAD